MSFRPSPRRWAGLSPSGFFAAAVLIAFGVSMSLIYRGIVEDGRRQIVLRQAAETRGSLANAQLGLEAALRGYANTNDPSYLIPYRAAVAGYPALIGAMRSEIGQLAKDGSTEGMREAADTEARAFFDYKQNVGDAYIGLHVNHPLRPGVERLVLPYRSRSLVILARATTADRQLGVALAAAANQASSDLHALVVRVATTGLIGLFVLGGFAIVSSRREDVLAREARDARDQLVTEQRINAVLTRAFTQRGLPSLPQVGLHATYVPAEQETRIGGDWYDAFELPGGRLLFTIGDVTGHGVDAAITMSRARQAIVTAAMRERDPAAVLEQANASLVLQEDRLVTAVCGFVDLATLEIVYATAGHPPPVIVQPGAAAKFLPFGGVPLGAIADATYTSHRVQIDERGLVVLYTDGVIEYDRDILAGEGRLLAAIDAAWRAGGDLAVSIRDAVFRGALPGDDVAILTIDLIRRGNDGITRISSVQTNVIELRESQPGPDADESA
jgi:hypothetical protein